MSSACAGGSVTQRTATLAVRTDFQQCRGDAGFMSGEIGSLAYICTARVRRLQHAGEYFRVRNTDKAKEHMLAAAKLAPSANYMGEVAVMHCKVRGWK